MAACMAFALVRVIGSNDVNPTQKAVLIKARSALAEHPRLWLQSLSCFLQAQSSLSTHFAFQLTLGLLAGRAFPPVQLGPHQLPWILAISYH